MRVIFQFFNVILVSVLLVLLQVYLSGRKSRIPGLVLPLLFFFGALLYPFSMTVPGSGVTAGFVFQMFAVFLLANIPTAVLLAVYFVRRKKSGRKSIDKMNIQDLG